MTSRAIRRAAAKKKLPSFAACKTSADSTNAQMASNFQLPIAALRDGLERASQGSVAQKLRHHMPPMRMQSMLKYIQPLPCPQRHPSIDNRDR